MKISTRFKKGFSTTCTLNLWTDNGNGNGCACIENWMKN